jgi:hypothetical protein
MDPKSNPLSTVVHALFFPLRLCWEFIVAYKHATWDQAREALQHVRAPYVPAPAKWLLGVGLAVELLIAFKLWLLLHLMLPFLLASPVEDLLMVPPLCVMLWGFNLYSRRKKSATVTERLQRRLGLESTGDLKRRLELMAVPPVPEDLQHGGRTVAPGGVDEVPAEVLATQERKPRR